MKCDKCGMDGCSFPCVSAQLASMTKRAEDVEREAAHHKERAIGLEAQMLMVESERRTALAAQKAAEERARELELAWLEASGHGQNPTYAQLKAGAKAAEERAERALAMLNKVRDVERDMLTDRKGDVNHYRVRLHVILDHAPQAPAVEPEGSGK